MFVMIHIYCISALEKKLLKKTLPLGFLKFNIKSWSIVFFGSDNFSLFGLKALNEQMKLKLINNMEIVVINDKSPVFKYAVSNGFKTHFWPPNLNRYYDFGIIVSFGKFIPKSIIEYFSLGIINVHGSLLPKYRGGMPIIHAIKNGETETGITVIKIRPDNFDTGEIILQKPCSIGENELMPSLFKRLTELGCECLVEVISSMPECLKKSIPQSGGVSYAPKLSKEAAIVKWKDMTALEIFNLYRALFSIFQLRSFWQGRPVKLLCLFLSNSDLMSAVAKESMILEPGSFLYNQKSKFLHVQCKDKQIVVCTVKFNGKIYSASAFYYGYAYKISKDFWKFES